MGSDVAKSALTIMETNPSFSSFPSTVELIGRRLVSRWDRDLLELGLSQDWPVFEEVRGIRSMTDLIFMTDTSCYRALPTDI